MAILAVADGHGGDPYPNSATGARLVCDVALNMLREFCTRTLSKPGDAEIERLCHSIVANWTIAVNADARGDVQSYGCTLIAFAITPAFWVAVQIGDGRLCLLNHRGKWRQPVPWDDRCILNLTTSMANEDAALSFRHSCGVRRPKAVVLCSDGVDGTFGSGKLLYNFYTRILRSVYDEGFAQVRAQLPHVLSHYSAVGSRDDMSLALLLTGPPGE